VAPKPAAPAAAPEGDLVLFLDGSTHFFREEYRAAAAAFAGLGERHPDSRLRPKAAALAALAKQLDERGVSDAPRAADEGRAHINAVLGSRAAPAARREHHPDRRPIDARLQQAERDFRVAEFYARTGHPGAACFYYALVSRNYPGTAPAARAAERLRELRKPADGAPQAGGAPARVGRVTVNGNRQTPDALILYQLTLRPGEVLTYPALSAAERNLAALRGVRATVRVSDAGAPGGFKELLVEVQEPSGRAEGARPGDSGEFRTPVLPPLQPGQRPGCDDRPGRAAVLRALPPLARGVPYLHEVSRDDVEVTVERLVNRIDPPRFYPLVGLAQLHRCHYRCTVCYTETVQASWPFPFQCRRRRSDIVYLDRDHLHLVRPQGPGGAGAITPGATPTPGKAGVGA
jgi:hypothetical protein